jgi:hypothetical protein
MHLECFGNVFAFSSPLATLGTMPDDASDPQLRRSELDTLRLDRAALAGVLAQREAC